MCDADTTAEIDNTVTATPMLAYLSAHDFLPTASNRVHRHPATGARVVIDNACVTIHARAGAWTARLTRVPFAVFTAAVTAAITRPASEKGQAPR